ncbi:MAG: glycosyltransferase family 4 protein [Oligoflexales bacterium]|nr:glycosyltransferase family 4 protein [Oligoflexales bacterium]
MRVAFVVQRYGNEVVGGAESLARQLARRVVEDLHIEVEVFTTTAKDYTSWENYYSEGQEVLDGIKVHRYNSEFKRRRVIFGLYKKIVTPVIEFCARFSFLESVQLFLERYWFVLQGPFCPALVRAIAQKKDLFHRYYFFTYLYYPTVMGLPAVRDRAVLFPTAHNEKPFFFKTIKKLISSPKMILANTPFEKFLVERNLCANVPIKIAGIGFDKSLLQMGRVLNKARDIKYILYLGRIGRAKGVDTLIKNFLNYISEHDVSDLHLYLAGRLEDVDIPDNSSIKYLGFVDDDEKNRLIADACCLVNPSMYESLSIIVIEAMVLMVPVLVNENCEVLRHYCDETKTVFGYKDRESFNAKLSHILESGFGLSGKMRGELESTRDWAVQRFSWESVTRVFGETLI